MFLGLLSAPVLAQLDSLERRGPAQRIVILGGGLAGLCAAYELQSQGHQPTVLEGQLRPGGRVHTIRHRFAPGLYGEAGAEAIPQSHDITQHYAREFNLTLLPNNVAGTRGFYHLARRRIFVNSQAEWPNELVRSAYAGTNRFHRDTRSTGRPNPLRRRAHLGLDWLDAGSTRIGKAGGERD
jgi:monoamine oxidase